jgi:hypothetical protein
MLLVLVLVLMLLMVVLLLPVVVVVVRCLRVQSVAGSTSTPFSASTIMTITHAHYDLQVMLARISDGSCGIGGRLRTKQAGGSEDIGRNQSYCGSRHGRITPAF